MGWLQLDSGNNALAVNIRTAEGGYASERVQSAFDVRDPSTPETILRETETNTLLAACISGLTPRHQELLTLRYEHELTFGEIAHRWKTSTAAVSTMHTRAIQRLRTSLELMGASYSGLV